VIVAYSNRRNTSFWMCIGCVPHAYEEKGECKCIDKSNATIDGQCTCVASVFFYYNSNTDKCLSCPYGCICDLQRGCYFCEYSQLRNISLDPVSNLSVCPCVNGAIAGDPEGNCYCSVAKTNGSKGCACPEPYYMNASGQCSCKSNLDSKHYYYNKQSN